MLDYSQTLNSEVHKHFRIKRKAVHSDHLVLQTGSAELAQYTMSGCTYKHILF